MRVSLLTRVENAHDDAVWGVSWSPASAGGFLATGSVDESVKIWGDNSASGGGLEQVHQLVRPSRGTRGMGGRDGVGEGRGGRWDVSLSSPLPLPAALPSPSLTSPSLSPLPSLSSLSSLPLLLSLPLPLRHAPPHPLPPFLLFSFPHPPSPLLPPPPSPQLGLELGVLSVSHDPSGTYGACTSMDAVINAWDASSRQGRARIERAPAEAWGCCFCPLLSAPPTLAVAAGAANAVAIYDVRGTADAQAAAAAAAAGGGAKDEAGGEGDETPGPAKGAEAAAASAVAPVPTVLPLPRADGRPSTGQEFALSVSWSPDGRLLAVGSMDGSVALFDAVRAAPLGLLEGHSRPVRSLAFTPDSRHLITACDDQHARIFDAGGRHLVAAISGHQAWVTSVDVHPSGDSFVTASADGRTRIWDFGTRTLAQTLSDHEDQVWGVAYAPGGGRLATVSDDASVCLYTVQA